MIGNHVASVAAEAIRKGITDFDVETLYEGLRKNALEGTMIPWPSTNRSPKAGNRLTKHY